MCLKFWRAGSLAEWIRLKAIGSTDLTIRFTPLMLAKECRWGDNASSLRSDDLGRLESCRRSRQIRQWRGGSALSGY
jgi:hypothetical protein